jgi:hypothetical protein
MSRSVRMFLMTAVSGCLFISKVGATTPTATPSIPPCGIGVVCEAEKVLSGGGVVISAVHAGYTGSGFADYPGTGAGYVEWPISVPTAGTYQLIFRYANGSTSDRAVTLLANGGGLFGSVGFPATGSWTTWKTIAVTVNLPAGVVNIRAREFPNGPNMDSLKVIAGAPPTPTITPTPTNPACNVGATCEAETAARGGGVVIATNQAGYTGSGFADYPGTGNGYVEWAINVPADDTYTMTFRYANGDTVDRPMLIRANGVALSYSMSFLPTGGWTTWKTAVLTATLPAGLVRIRATEFPNGPNVDNLVVARVLPTPTPTPWVTGYMTISTSKVDPKVGEQVTISVAGNTGLGSFGLVVEGDPIFVESPMPSPSNGGTSWSWTLTVGRPGNATLKASVYGETQNGCSSCFVYTTVSAASSAITASGTTSPTPTPAPQGFISNTVWRLSSGDLLVRADIGAALAPSWTTTVIDNATGLPQDPANPLVTLKGRGLVPPSPNASLDWWTFTPVRSGSVTFETTVTADFPCGTGCSASRTVSTRSWAQSVTVP